jgi:membrane associated rhomboid family serine protease
VLQALPEDRLVVIPVHDEDHGYFEDFRPWVMWTILAANVATLICVWLLAEEMQNLIAFTFGVVPAFLIEATAVDDLGLPVSPYATLVTYTFLHGSWIHLAGNMIFLWVFGDNVEAAMGHFRFALFYILCGAAGGVAHVASDPASAVPLVGASGAIAGIVAAYLMLHPWAHVTVLVFGLVTARIHAYWLLGAWIAWQFVAALLLSSGEVAYWSHVGGLLTGAALVVVLRRPGVGLFQRHLAHWR